jgi:hypothetical protein
VGAQDALLDQLVLVWTSVAWEGSDTPTDGSLQVLCNVAAGPRPTLTTFKKPVSVDLRDEGSESKERVGGCAILQIFIEAQSWPMLLALGVPTITG